MRIIIADTSCLILFTKINELGIIQDTFNEVVVTDKVEEEYGDLPSWIIVRNDYNKEAYEKLCQKFGPGESSCIALAQKETTPLLIIDDRKAKQVAEDIGIECVGSLGLLLLAKREGVLLTIGPVIEKILATNFRLSRSLVDLVLKLANEE